MNHIPVLLKEIISFFEPKPNENFIDATFGDGGHSVEILKHTAPEGKILAIDWDKKAIESFDGHGLDTRSIFKYVSEPQTAPAEASEQDRSGVEPMPVRRKERLILVCGNFADIYKIADSADFKEPKGVLFDFGFRTFHIEESGKGFSFQKDEPLDMRYNADKNALTAGGIVNKWAEKDLERIFREYGEERNAKRIARSITESRERGSIKTSGELVEIINSRDVKTLARIFQALRIAVNNELENIKLGLEGAWNVIGKDGKIAAISFHSLEDRIVKNFFADKKKIGEGEILTKKPVIASEEEIKNNPKSRSAKLRVIRKRPI